MFILRNSVKNIYRYRSKYLLMGIILFIIVLIASVIIGISNYSAQTTESLKMKYASMVTVSKGLNIGIKNFNKSDYLLLNDCEYVERVDFSSYIISSVSMGHTKYDITEQHKAFYSEEDYEALKNQPPVVETEITIKSELHKLTNLNINPVYIMGYEYNILPDDKKARFVLESGRMYETDNECVISINPLIPDETWNLLSVGDTIKISVHNGIEKEYTVTGILKSDDNITADTKTRVLFTTFNSAEAFGSALETADSKSAPVTTAPVNNPIEPSMYLSAEDEDSTEVIERYEVLVALKSYDYYNSFQSYLRELGGYYSFPLYENFTSLLSLLNQSYAWSILFIVIIAIVLVVMTIFTTMLNFNSRKYEIAVLRSVGMKKSYLIFSYLIENLVFVWGITAAASIVAQIIEPIFIEKVFSSIHNMLTPGILESIASATGLSMIFQNIGIVYGGMTVTVILSLVLTCINILRFQPLKIFNKQY